MVSFKHWMLVCLIGLLMIPSLVHAKEDLHTNYSNEERLVLTRWAQDNTHAKLKLAESDARAYVDLAYLHGFAAQIDPLVILAMMRIESRFDKNAVSREGARGLMQVIPRWHRDKIQGRNIHSPTVNIEVGVKVLSDCWSKHQGRVQAVMVCYSGGSKGYAQKVVAMRKQMSQVIVAQRALMDAEPILASLENHAVSPTALQEKSHVQIVSASAAR